MTQEQLQEAAENYALSEETLSPQPYDSDFSLHAVYLESFIAGATSQAAKEYWQGKVGEWQRCPICEGSGAVFSSGLTTNTTDNCPVCSGARIIPKPITP